MKRLSLPLLLLSCLVPIAAPAQTVLQNTTYNSTVTVSGPATIDADTAVTVASGANVTFEATSSIRLGPGFTAVSGSNFHTSLIVSPLAPTIISSSTAIAILGTPFQYTIRATNTPTLFGASGLPAPLTLNTSTGVISGTGTSTGVFNITLSASNMHGTTTRALTLTIDQDSDNDGIPNSWEQQYGLNPASATDALLDPDGDGWTNVAEFNRGTNPNTYDVGTSTLGNDVPGGWSALVSEDPVKAAKAVGTTAGELSVDKSGAAGYSIPIWVSPGTAGMEPKLALNYSSAAGAGIAGYGWSLSGLSAISRGPKTRPIDGVIHAVDFTYADQYYLDGQRLILVAGTHGQDGAEYRTELESFSRVVAQGSAGQGPQSFKVWTKAGLILEFGATADSRLTVNAPGHSEVLTWGVNRISDTSGNVIDFQYANDFASGEYRVTRINYGGHVSSPVVAAYASVRFEYETRNDISIGYLAGAKFSRTQRLKAIKSYVDGFGPEWLVRTYTLGYIERDNTQRSLLSTLTETGSNGISYPDLTFNYEAPAAGWEANTPFAPPYTLGYSGTSFQPGAGFVDLNGDGKTDFIYKRDANGPSGAYLNTGVGWAAQSSFELPWPLASSTGDDAGSRFVDLNGDGRPDFIWRKHGAGGNLQGQGVLINTGSGWTTGDSNWLPPAPIARDSYPKHGGSFLDVNGDGRVDFVAPLGGVYLNTGNGWSYHGGFSAFPFDYAYYKGRFVDVNGDGLPDLVVSYSGNNQTVIGTWLNTGAGWTQSTAYTVPSLMTDDIHTSTGAEFADVNGDGLVDFIWYREGAGNPRGLAINTGTGWWQQSPGDAFYELLSPFPLSRDGTLNPGTTLQDLNGDGLVDLALSRIVNGITSVATNLGAQTRWYGLASGSPQQLPVILNQPGVYSQGVDFVDLDADGLVDIVYKQDNLAGGAYLNRSHGADRMISVVNGFGVTAEINYKPLTDPAVYSKGTGATFPVMDVIAPGYVVSRVKHADGLGGTYDISYSYGELRAHADRGSLGFGWMSVLDTRKNIVSLTTFSQEYPFIGMPVDAVTKTDGGAGITLSESQTIYGAKPLNSGKTRFVFGRSSLQTTHDLTGALVSYSGTLTQRGAADDYSDYDDYGNSLYVWTDAGDGHWKSAVNEYFAPTITSDKWILGRLQRSTVTAQVPGLVSQTRTSSFTYDSNTGLLLTETVEPDVGGGDPNNLKVTNTYEYDAFGNKTSSTVSGGGMSPRITSTAYDQRGRFPDSSTNALGHTETYTYYQTAGVLANQIGPNGLQTSWNLDGMNRKTQEVHPDGTVSEMRRKWASASAPAGSLYLVETESTGAAPSVVFYDSFGRQISSFGINGGLANGNALIVGSSTTYDAQGRVYQTSLPFYFGAAIEAATQTDYDLLDRPTTVSTRDDEVAGTWVQSTYSYDGLTTRVTNPKGQRADSVRNLPGQVIAAIANASAATSAPDRGEVQYGYDVQGNITTTSVRREDGSWVTTTLSYDQRGRKISMIDPDMGTWTYRYNAAGELISQTDAKNQTTTLNYDALGRMGSRIEPEGTTTWTYDTATKAGGTWKGKLHTVTGPADRGKTYSETYSYDTLGRPASIARLIDGTTYTTSQAYDNLGRPTTSTYPSGFKTVNVYNAFGFLKEVREGNGNRTTFLNEVTAGQVFWQADRYGITGQVDGSTLGNGLVYDRVISTMTGRVHAISAGVGAGTVQFHQYFYDSVGNVTRRYDAATNRDERFEEYDGLNRLKSHRVVGGATVTVAYDALGNITNKSDVGSYTYGGPRPHAVTSAGVNSYSYDANGNMDAGGGRSLEWTSYNQLRKVTQSGQNTEFWFGAAHERVVQQHSNGAKTIYVGALFEKTTAGGLIEEKHYVMTPLGRTAVRTVRNDGKVETRYFHQDGLGSIAAVSDEAGRVEKRFTFDAWGKRVKTADTHTGAGGTLTRGYTDHEHLEDFALIHMNGRVFDPLLGRFTSADPFIGDVEDSQEYNRYSYVGNNPLNAIDPSGYFKLKDLFMVSHYSNPAYWLAPKTYKQYEPMLRGIVVSAVLTYASWGIAAPWAGAAGGAVSGFESSLLNGGSVGDAFKSGMIGGATGYFTAYASGVIGDTFKEYGYYGATGEIARAAFHGAVSGGITEVMGGEFRHGFYAGAAGSIFGGATNFGGDDLGSVMARTTVSAVVGGTVSELGGGKFANGAITSAFQHLFNNEAHLEARQDRMIQQVLDGKITAEQLLELQRNDAVVGLAGLGIVSGGGVIAAADSASTSAYVYATTHIGPWVAGATGGLYQWLRFGPSYSRELQQPMSYSIRWGASPRFAYRIGNDWLRSLNQWVRQLKIPIDSWRTNDPGHLHLKK